MKTDFGGQRGGRPYGEAHVIWRSFVCLLKQRRDSGTFKCCLEGVDREGAISELQTGERIPDGALGS